MNITVPQPMLGHASASMTLDRYSGLFDDDLVGVAHALSSQASERTDTSICAPVGPD